MPRTVDCNFCGQNNTELVQKAENPFQVVKCKTCGLVFTRPQPDKGLIEEHYQEDYYKEWPEDVKASHDYAYFLQGKNDSCKYYYYANK